MHVRWAVIDSLEEKITELRKKLTEIVQNKGGFADEEVIRISQQLDAYIVEMQARQGKRKSQWIFKTQYSFIMSFEKNKPIAFPITVGN